ncbi:hypothetical protein ZIOFF_016056 [Zingiber officinale]|uniref:RING-type domain-containing protein n=1 Tax=Zingiber officinale TaxID=94328 RepID=A0A8J5LUL5_ZINOF|nr:hypothetical protein ZIOFF_016056 [Zingiber officinale]
MRLLMNDEMRLVNHGEPDAESLVEWFESGSLAPSSRAETDGYVQYANRPPGLSSKAFSNLRMEVYVERAFLDCSICLERFVEGEELIQLSCRHRFHPDCLEPWAKIYIWSLGSVGSKKLTSHLKFRSWQILEGVSKKFLTCKDDTRMGLNKAMSTPATGPAWEQPLISIDLDLKYEVTGSHECGMA